MSQELTVILLTLKLASVVTILLLAISVPIAFWLSQTKSPWKSAIESFVALPIVLPPTVIGFYLLWFLGPQGWGGALTQSIGIGLLPFTFSGLVIGSLIYSLPFVVQPLQNSFEAIGCRPQEVAATLQISPWNTFWRVTLPLAKSGIITAAILGFLHTLGEFGVVLMIGGNIPGQTQLLSVLIYDRVEALDYAGAHRLAFSLLAFSFLGLYLLFRKRKRVGTTAWKK